MRIFERIVFFKATNNTNTNKSISCCQLDASILFNLFGYYLSFFLLLLLFFFFFFITRTPAINSVSGFVSLLIDQNGNVVIDKWGGKFTPSSVADTTAHSSYVIFTPDNYDWRSLPQLESCGYTYLSRQSARLWSSVNTNLSRQSARLWSSANTDLSLQSERVWSSAHTNLSLQSERLCSSANIDLSLQSERLLRQPQKHNLHHVLCSYNDFTFSAAKKLEALLQLQNHLYNRLSSLFNADFFF